MTLGRAAELTNASLALTSLCSFKWSNQARFSQTQINKNWHYIGQQYGMPCAIRTSWVCAPHGLQRRQPCTALRGQMSLWLLNTRSRAAVPKPLGGTGTELLLSDGSGPHMLQQLCHRLAKQCDERFFFNEGWIPLFQGDKTPVSCDLSENALTPWRKGTMEVYGRMGGKHRLDLSRPGPPFKCKQFFCIILSLNHYPGSGFSASSSSRVGCTLNWE